MHIWNNSIIRRMPLRKRAFLKLCNAGLFLLLPVHFTAGLHAQVTLPESNQCIACHKNLPDDTGNPAHVLTDDVHSQFGLFCQDCHGGDPDQKDKALAKTPQTGYRGKPSYREIPEFCNSCHGDELFMKKYNPNIRIDQYERYLTSTHGGRLLKGDDKVAVCTSCHQPHSTRSTSNIRAWTYPLNIADTCGKCHSNSEYMKEYAIPTDQKEKYHASIHYKYLSELGDLSAPACNDCHGNHSAVPPGVTSVMFVCGTCHASNEALFQQSSHNEYFTMLEKPGCITCHDNHETARVTEEGLDLENGAYCGQCHFPDDETGNMIARMRGRLDSLRSRYEYADSLIQVVERKGMDVNDPEFLLTQAKTILTRSRHMIHAFSLEEVTGVSEEGMEILRQVTGTGHNALREIRIRRIGLALSLIFIALACALLYIKIVRYRKSEQSALTQSSGGI